MNIFALDEKPEKAVKMYLDSHVVKQILETAQMLSAAHRIFGSNDDVFYKLTHKNHPCTKWIRENSANYFWGFRLFDALCTEYTYRYNKIHLSETKLYGVLSFEPKLIPISNTITPFPQAMPLEFRSDNSIEAYRNYYKYKFKVLKRKTWTKRPIPLFLLDTIPERR